MIRFLEGLSVAFFNYELIFIIPNKINKQIISEII